MELPLTMMQVEDSQGSLLWFEMINEGRVGGSARSAKTGSTSAASSTRMGVDGSDEESVSRISSGTSIERGRGRGRQGPRYDDDEEVIGKSWMAL